MRAATVAVSDRVWCVLWEASSLLAASGGIWLTWEQIPASDFILWWWWWGGGFFFGFFLLSLFCLGFFCLGSDPTGL